MSNWLQLSIFYEGVTIFRRNDDLVDFKGVLKGKLFSSFLMKKLNLTHT